MPSQEHDGLLRLVELRPELAAELLELAGVTPPPHETATLSATQLTDVEPAELRADAVVVLSRGEPSEPVLGIVVETQLGHDSDKRWVWPAYAISLRLRLKCPTCVLVIAPSAAVAARAAKPVDTGPPDNVFRAIVVGPSRIPVITEAAEALRAPEIALLSVFAHGDGPDAERIALAALAAALRVPDDRQLLYSDLDYLAVGEATRLALEKLMSNGPYVYKSEFAKKHRGEGRAEGRAEGRVEGLTEGLTKSVLALLEARSIAITTEDRERVLACKDEATLSTWLRRAATALTRDTVFDA